MHVFTIRTIIWDWKHQLPSFLVIYEYRNTCECRQVSVLAGVAKQDIPKGTQLKVAGHHHSIDGPCSRTSGANTAKNAAPSICLMEQSS